MRNVMIPAGPFSNTIAASPMRRVMAALLALSATCGVAAQNDQTPARRDADQRTGPVVIRVTDKSGMFDGLANGAARPTIYLASNAGQWKADGVASDAGPGSGAPVDGGWVIALPETLLRATMDAGGVLEYKLTRGSWATVEVDAQGRDLANRRLDLRVNEAAGDTGGALTEEITVEGFADQRGTRWTGLGARASTVTGTLDVLDFTSTIRGNTRKVRVWLPPGYDAAHNADRRYPVLVMHDGQNCFDDATSFSGEWGVDETMTRLIEEQKVPPTIVVGIDNAGAQRGDEYVPIAIGARMPGVGGKADEYVSMVIDEVLPLISVKYRTLVGPEHLAMGGSSFGGIVTLHTVTTRPGVIGAALVESPSLWIGTPTGGYVERLLAYDGAWPARIFMATGGKEYGDEARDKPLQAMFTRLVEGLRKKGLGATQLQATIEPEGTHHESTWRRRLPGALEFLLGSAAPKDNAR
jgi:predicted alpha/beta superfamily hydrolase